MSTRSVTFKPEDSVHAKSYLQGYQDAMKDIEAGKYIVIGATLPEHHKLIDRAIFGIERYLETMFKEVKKSIG